MVRKRMLRTEMAKRKNIFFRIIAFLEGVSFILLLFIAMPIKYGLENPSPVKIIGMVHGVLFILFVLLAFLLAIEQKWKIGFFFKVLGLSLVPFGTFYLDRELRTHRSKHI